LEGLKVKKKKGLKKNIYKFKYDNSIMKKYLNKYNLDIEKEIFIFLTRI
jgi:hypothetical protein